MIAPVATSHIGVVKGSRAYCYLRERFKRAQNAEQLSVRKRGSNTNIIAKANEERLKSDALGAASVHI